jgi:hypothetical protein
MGSGALPSASGAAFGSTMLTDGGAFGSKDAAAFGSKVTLAAKAFTRAHASNAKRSSAGGEASIGHKRKRSADDTEARTAANKAKVARVVAEMFDEGMKAEVAARLRSAGLALAAGEDAFDPVMSHRAW